LLGYYKSFA